MKQEALNLLPVYKVEHNCILSYQGDVTIAYRATLPELFTLSDREYEAYHQAWRSGLCRSSLFFISRTGF
jgi:hypothetical protein